MSVARAVHTSTLLSDGRVLIAGGFDDAGNNLQTTELYDPNAASFARVPGQFGDSPLFAAATRLLDGRVLITGGYSLHSFARPNAWMYAP